MLALVPDELFIATIVTVALPPLAMTPRAQVTIVVPVHEPWLGVAEMKVIPAGSGSERLTSFALCGPLLVTVSV